jgi:hypothetical protein
VEIAGAAGSAARAVESRTPPLCELAVAAPAVRRQQRRGAPGARSSARIPHPVVLACSEHKGITCDGCSVVPIFGIRYKCTKCKNHDFCEVMKIVSFKLHHLHTHTLTKRPSSQSCFEAFQGGNLKHNNRINVVNRKVRRAASLGSEEKGSNKESSA